MPRLDEPIAWASLSPEHRLALAKRLSAVVGNADDPAAWWDAMTPADQRHWLWLQDHPVEARSAYQAEVARINGAADPATQAAFDMLHSTDMLHPNGNSATVDYQSDNSRAVLDGERFIFEQPSSVKPRWGKGGDVLWERGESLFLVGPTGVGKTTLSGQIVAGLIGIVPDVLGFPMEQAARVLYFAMDRPRQIARAWGRLFTTNDKNVLSDRLTVWRGPLPMQLDAAPEALVELAHRYEAEVVIIDSLKDAVARLGEDGPAGNFNRAVQFCSRDNIDVLTLHHQRKAVEGHKPTALEDVYGNTWLTAGAGSVVLLWGEAGSEVVELTHLKQPADPVGPLIVEHDHLAGTSSVRLGWDALHYLTMRGSGGATLDEAVQAHYGRSHKPGGAQWKATERRLRRLVSDGLATHRAQPGIGHSARYTAVLQPTVHGTVNGSDQGE